MNPIIVYLTQTILRYFISNVLGGGGGGKAVMLQEAKKLSTHCMPVKVLGQTDLPFFIPAQLTALPLEFLEPP